MGENVEQRQQQKQQHGTNMGQILMKFFELFRLTPGSQSTNPENYNRTLATSDIGQKMNETMGRLNATRIENNLREMLLDQTSKNETSNTTTIMSMEDNVKNGTDHSISTISSSTLLGKLRSQIKLQSVSSCEQTKCHEWSFERLLKARLCCLNSQNYSEDIGNDNTLTSSGARHIRSSLLRRSARNPNNENNGCQQYKHDRCGLILPVIKCCLQKELNNYFDRVIRKRAQQQRQQLGGGAVISKETQLGLTEGRGALLSPRVELSVIGGGGQLEAISVDSLLMAASARADGSALAGGSRVGQRQSYHKRVDQSGSHGKLC